MSDEPLNNEQNDNPKNTPVLTPASVQDSGKTKEKLEEVKPAEGVKIEENNSFEPNLEPVNSEPISAPSSGEAGTGQTPVSDPLPSSAPVTTDNPVSAISKPNSDFAKATPGRQKDLWKKFLDKVQIGKRKKLEKIMTLFLKQSKITNDEVEKFLRVSDKTAERYLNILEKENKIKQVGKTGHAVSYTKI